MAKLVIGTDKTVGAPAFIKEVTPVEPYPLLSRVKDDSNNDIGIVVGYHTDANNQKYAVVCLNKEFRKSQYFSYSGTPQSETTGLPKYSNLSAYDAPETATFNGDKILATGSSSAVTECRSYFFVINGVTYYGQLPSISELMLVMMHRTVINTNDPSVSGTEITIGWQYLSSTQSDTTNCWDITAHGQTYKNNYKGNNVNVIPILEIPIS